VQELLAIVHRHMLLDDPALVSELVTTASLALEHERLHAARRARLEQLRASRARIVATADAERRQLERDLHDGAQQRLVALALSIRLTRRTIAAGDDELDARLAAAETGVRAAAVELRNVAHGLFPAVLAEEGLAAALLELSEQSPRLVPRALPGGRFPREVESAAYFATVESLRLTESDVVVEAAADDGHLRLEIDVGNPIADAMQLADALRRIDEDECVIDPTIVSRLVARKRARGPLDVLTEREREVLALVAEGRSNGAIGERLFLSRKTVDSHISQIFIKPDLRVARGPPASAGSPCLPALRLRSFDGTAPDRT
jgi:DNA-binding CsgD family transcriptional regulator